jgi:hypothetical protein
MLRTGFGVNVIPDATVHRFHSAPNAGPTGRGNHYNAASLFGIDYPCTVVPDAVATMPGYYGTLWGRGFTMLVICLFGAIGHIETGTLTPPPEPSLRAMC